MRFHRPSKLLLTLLLAASLPLRLYATPCEPPTAHIGHAAVVHHAAHCEPGSPGGHAACDCCGAAIAAAPSVWAPPHEVAASASARLPRHSPILTLERLDRPPRQPA